MAYATPELTLLGRASGVVLGINQGFEVDSDVDCPRPLAAQTPCVPLGEW